MKDQAKKWIVEVYMNLEFQYERELSTLVNLEEFQINSIYNDSLRKFLKLSINENEILKLKYVKNKNICNSVRN